MSTRLHHCDVTTVPSGMNQSCMVRHFEIKKISCSSSNFHQWMWAFIDGFELRHPFRVYYLAYHYRETLFILSHLLVYLFKSIWFGGFLLHSLSLGSWPLLLILMIKLSQTWPALQEGFCVSFILWAELMVWHHQMFGALLFFPFSKEASRPHLSSLIWRAVVRRKRTIVTHLSLSLWSSWRVLYYALLQYLWFNNI